MASHDSGVDTSNDSNGTNEGVIALRTLERSLMDFNAMLLQSTQNNDSGPAFGSKPTRSRLKTISIPSTPRRMYGRIEHDASCSSDVPYSCNFPKERKLRLAASICNTELLNRLLDAGADPDAADEHLRSPLHLAASRGYSTIVKSLLAHHANPNVQDTLGNTPLHLAICSASSYNFNLVVRLLVQHGCNVTLTDRSGKTPLDLARSKLLLMRTRLGVTKESAQHFVEMSMLTGLLRHTLTKQVKDMQQFDDLEARLRNLSTKEIEDGADQLLADVAGLDIN